MLPNKKPDTYRLIHISDLHFQVFPTNIFSCFNKRIVSLFRQLFCTLPFKTQALEKHLIPLLQSLKTDGLCITGDFTLSALKKEFILAKCFIQKIQKVIPDIYTLPGNHDAYTHSDFIKKTYYNYFPDPLLKQNAISFKELPNNWWLILLDCCRSNGFIEAKGIISLHQIEQIEKFLQTLSNQDNVIIANHFPLIQTSYEKRELLQANLLQECLKKYSQIKIYLHGHEHKAFIHTLDNPPYNIINSGSISAVSNGIFHTLDLRQGSYDIHTMTITNLNKYEDDKTLNIEITNTQNY